MPPRGKVCGALSEHRTDCESNESRSLVTCFQKMRKLSAHEHAYHPLEKKHWACVLCRPKTSRDEVHGRGACTSPYPLLNVEKLLLFLPAFCGTSSYNIVLGGWGAAPGIVSAEFPPTLFFQRVVVDDVYHIIPTHWFLGRTQGAGSFVVCCLALMASMTAHDLPSFCTSWEYLTCRSREL